MTNDTRAAFEAWAKSEGLTVARTTKRDLQGYDAPDTDYAWMGWLASRRAALDEAAKVCEEHAKIHVDGSYEQGEAEYLAEAIRALADEGVKL